MMQHDDVREALLDREDDQPLAPEAQAHLDECEDCRAFAAALESVDARLAELPAIEAPEPLIARTMERVEREPAPSLGVGAILFGVMAALFGGVWAFARLLALPFTSRRARPWTLGGLGLAVPAAGALLLTMTTGREMSAPLERQIGVADAETTELPMAGPTAGDVLMPPADVDQDGLGDDARRRFSRLGGYQLPEGSAEAPRNGLDDDARSAIAEFWGDIDGEEERDQGGTLQADQPAQDVERTAEEANAEVIDRVAVLEQRAEPRTEATGEGATGLVLDFAEPADQGIAPGPSTIVTRPGNVEERSVDAPADHRAQAAPTPSNERATTDGRFATTVTSQTTPVDEDRDAAARFLEEREQVDGLTFRPATGHWASTYVPGDPAVRALRSRLTGSPEALALAERAEPTDLGLDAPSSGALAVRVSADRAAVRGRSRVLVSVGVRGAEARAGRRPTLQMQVVIDARSGLDAEGQARVRALLTALSRRRQGSDRIGVIVAGPHGGALLPLGNLRFGELTVAMRRLFGESDAPAMPLDQAVRDAIASVGQLEDASSPLGSAVVLVVTPSLSDADARALEPAVHAGTLAGVTTTTLATSDAASMTALERIAIAGQGRRRVLGSIDEADALVASEVEAVSRVVARAVRLRIRLAPGVSLVDVIGSRPLDSVETRRVREAERAVDRELARRLGVTSDRDEEEDGIQIVMPAFYAGDQHAVLLDLVVPGPGAVADVSVRWKDLVRLGNGSASERLTLSEGAPARGPRERRVLAQLAAHELARALREAASHLERGAPELARARVAEARALVAALREHTRTDETDVALCAAYEAALAQSNTQGLADSLRYASVRRLHGEPLSIDGR